MTEILRTLDSFIQSHVIHTGSLVIDCALVLLAYFFIIALFVSICSMLTRSVTNKIIYYTAPLVVIISSVIDSLISVTALRFIFIHYGYDLLVATRNGTALPIVVWIVMITEAITFVAAIGFYIFHDHKAHFAKTSLTS